MSVAQLKLVVEDKNVINNTDQRISAAKTILLNKLFDSEGMKFIDPGRILREWKVQDIHHGKAREMAQLRRFIKSSENFLHLCTVLNSQISQSKNDRLNKVDPIVYSMTAQQICNTVISIEQKLGLS